MDVKQQIVNEIHKPARRNFRKRKVITKGIDDLWQADLVEMNSGKLKGISKINKGFKYLLTIIDTFSKYAWAIPIEDKTGKNITKAFQTLKRTPNLLQTDNGKEFYNKDFQNLMKDKNIHHYSTFNNEKASIVERFNRTLKEKMWKVFSFQGTYKWIDILPKLLNKYNNTVHRTIKMKPVEVNKENEEMLKKTVYNVEDTNEEPKFKVDDSVRISKIKGTFEKGYLPNWSNEVFKITKIIPSNPIVYKIKDYRNEEIKGTFYKEELMKTNIKDVYLVEKVIKKRGNKVLVKWLGFDDSHNSWI